MDNVPEPLARSDAARHADAIAIIGIGCRFPGGANNPEAFWRLLRDGVDAISEVPAKRWDVNALYDPDVSIPGKMNTRWGGFLEEIDQFDPGFFGISPAEAGRIDPQQRVVLEVAWEALEDAGQVQQKLAGSPTGVFIGVYSNDYSILQFSDVDSIAAHTSTGASHSIVANRLSYALDLRGPSVAVDTACSSSLVAIHLACQSLWNKECDLALAGGVNLVLTPVLTIAYSKLHMMAADGRCKSFDARGDGFVRGEGCGIIALKRLSDALSAGDPILALIRGSAVNHGGNANGLTAPNGLSQRELVRQALERAGVLPSQISYVETHGTGTPLGDPVEVEALASVVGPPSPDGQPCVLGSVKTNIGHLESAAGIAGLIKVVLSMQHGAIPPNLHFEKLNPNISLENTRLVIPTELRSWPSEAGPRYAGISSFGFGGANAHIVLEEGSRSTAAGPMRESAARGGACLLPLSARSAEALHSLSGSYLDLLSAEGSQPNAPMNDLCYTASVRRSHHEHRLALVGHSREDLTSKLKSFRAGEHRPGMSSGVLYQDRQLKLAFVFSGQGSQRFDMGRELMRQESLFRQSLEECDELFRPHAGWSLLEELGKDESQSRLDQTEVSQPAIFAIQIALAALWRSWGIHPFAVVGHSVGEVAAAYVANVLNLQDAVRVIFHRGRLMQQAAGQGKMLAAGLSWEEADHIRGSYKESLSIAAINSPASLVFSGEPAAVDHLFESLQRRKVFCRLLSGNYAFHSAQMAPFQGQLAKALEGLKPQPASIRIFSTVTGQACYGHDFDALYWSRNIREPVRFAAAMDELLIHGCDLFLEIGAHPDLSVPISQCLKHRNRDGALFPSLSRGRNEMEVMLGSLGGLYTQGFPFDWSRLYPSGGGRVRLPSYTWQHEPFWLDAPATARPQSVAHTGGSGLLGRHIKSAVPSETHFWEMEIGTQLFPYLKDHRVSELVLLPAAAYVEMALAAAVKAFGPGPHVLEGVSFKRMLSLPDEGVQKVQLVISPDFPGTASFQFFSLEEPERDGAWTMNVSGTIRIGRSGMPPPELAGCSPQEVQALCHRVIAGADHYEQMRQERDLYYGPSFQGIERVWRHEGEALARLRFTEEVSSRRDTYQIHPALLDACFQVLLTLPVGEGTTTYVPIGLERLRLCGRPDSAVWAHARVSAGPQSTTKTFDGDVSLLDEGGNVVLEARGLLLQRLGTVNGEGTKQDLSKLFYQLQWFPKTGLGQAKRLSPHYLMTPTQIAESVRSQAAPQPDIHRYDELTRKFDRLSTSYVLRACHQLGWELRPRQRVSLGHLGPQLGVVSQHRRLLGRMLEILEQEGIIKNAGSEWEVSSVRERENERDEIETLLSQYPECEAELTLVGRCGERLAEVLRGKCDPLQLLFPDGSLITTERLYRDSPYFSLSYNLLIQEAIGRALEGLPDRRTVRILEIGAGTGGTTSYVLPRLPGNRTEYVFTDVSDLFTTGASQKFKDYPFVQYRLLDIERDLDEQGFGAPQFDIILAANVLHATKDLSDTLKHVQQLSAPGALLVLRELTEPQRWLDLVFGLTEGWWKFADNKLRPSHPLLSQPKWLDLLTRTGFTDAVVIPDKGENGRTLSQQSVIMARAPQAQKVQPPRSKVQRPRGSWIIFGDKERVGQGLLQRLQSQGETCTLVLQGESYEFSTQGECQINPDHSEDFQRLVDDLLADGQPPCRGVVHLWSLDCASPDESTVKSLEPEHVSGCYSVLYLAQALARAGWTKTPRLWLVTRGAQTIATEFEPVSLIQSPVWGLARVITHEHPDLRCTTVDLDPAKPEYEPDALFQELWSEDSENQLAIRGDARYVARLVRHSTDRAQGGIEDPIRALPQNTNTLPLPVLDQPFRLTIRTPGVLDTLTLQTTTPGAPGPGEVGIEVRASGLNFSDLMKAMHIYPGLPNGLLSLGSECAGKIISIGEGVEGFQIGDEVVAITNHAFGTHAIADARLVSRKLDRHSFEEAATISLVFVTAFHALHSLARLGKGERVLIHSAAGGVGLAAVQLAERAGAEIFATAGNPEKREYLRSLGIRYVFDSRSLAFADEVMEHTSGEGVDVVLNSLTGEAIPKGLSILRPYGRFLEIGKRDIYRNSQIGLNPFRNNLSYFAIDLDRMFRERPAYVGSQLREVMQQFRDGNFHPLPLRVFPVSQVVAAFRFMAQAKQIGKIAVSLPEPKAPITHADPGRAEIRSDCTYLISGGFGGLGLEVAKWLVEHGARHLVLVGRRGVSATVQKTLDAMKRTDGEIVALQADVSQREQIAGVLDRIHNSMPPLRGIIHAAGTLDDGILLQLNRERFARVMAPKTEGAWNLHVLTRDLALDFFVLFSSAVSVLGSPGQGNHAAANAFLDALAHYRRAQGRPCLSINWGPWSEVGAAAESNRAGRLMLGILSISPEQGIQALEHLLHQGPAQVSVMAFELQKWYQACPRALESPSLLHLAREQGNTDVPRTQKSNIRESLVAAELGLRRSLLESHLREQISRVLKLPPSRIDPQKPLAAMGLDSLMVLEVSNLLESSLKVPLSATVIWNYPTVVVLADHLAQKMGVLLESPAKTPAQEKSTNQFSELEGQQIANVLAALKNLSGEDLH